MALDRIHVEPTGRSPELEAAANQSAKFNLTPQDVAKLAAEPLDDFGVGIESVKTVERKDLSTPHGTFFQRNVTMSDGQKHVELLGLSHDPNADLVAAAIPAWMTSPLTGFYTEFSNRLHRAGFHTLTKGVPFNRAASLSRGAHDLLVTITQYDKTGLGPYFEDLDLVLHGDSNGSMQGSGVLAYAPRFGKTIVDAYLVDPCIVRKIGRPDFEKFLRHPSYIPKEIYCLGKQAMRLVLHPDENIMNHLGTVEPSKEYVLGNILLSPALFSGEFGKLLAHVPPEQRVHYVLYRHSMANQKQDFNTVVTHRPGGLGNTTFETRTGTHMSIANPRTNDEKLDYLKASRAQLESID